MSSARRWREAMRKRQDVELCSPVGAECSTRALPWAADDLASTGLLPVVRACACHGALPRNRGKAQYLRDRKPTPSLCFCDPGATGLRFRPGGHSAVKPSTSVGICASKAALCATGHARISCDANAVLDRLLQSMGVRFSGSV